MLRAVPIEGLQAHAQDALRLALVARHLDALGESRVGLQCHRFDVCIDLQPGAPGIVHQEQAGPIVGRQVAGADVLAIAAIVREGQRSIVQHLQKAARSAAMLKVGPARLRHRGHVEAVALRDEGGFAFGEPVGLAVALEVAPQVVGAHGGLRRLHAGRQGDVHEAIRHCSLQSSRRACFDGMMDLCTQ